MQLQFRLPIYNEQLSRRNRQTVCSGTEFSSEGSRGTEMAHTEIARTQLRLFTFQNMCDSFKKSNICHTDLPYCHMRPSLMSDWPIYNRPAEEDLLLPGMRIREVWRKLSHTSNKSASNIVRLPNSNYSISLCLSSL